MFVSSCLQNMSDAKPIQINIGCCWRFLKIVNKKLWKKKIKFRVALKDNHDMNDL